ncbi:MAG: histidine--tRNA ligase [Bacteroidetes bacterium 41-46]|nr:MAG: histidine--tRNA ligase [Bacteroidetes bacterium 41-46]
MAQKPSIPKGTRDFSPAEMAGRDHIFNTVRTVFKKYGYSPIETPSMENLSTLLGKYGEEGDKLLFKVLNSGDAFSGVTPDMLSNSNSLSVKVCEKGLRYDLTVPFARYVVQHQSEIVFPFKRYQIQPVWRADRPQKGRYREFYQCDVDVIGSNSLINELELVQIVDDVFGKLGLSVVVKINNRKVLSGIAEVSGHADKLIDITVAIDKIDKIGIDAVKEELYSKGIDEDAVAIIEPILTLSGATEDKLTRMSDILSYSEIGLKGVEELKELFGLIESAGVACEVELDLSLARGLNYYTGAIFEVKSKETSMGSICGGGRYDDLTGIFGLKGVSGVGISFGADRIYDVISTLDRFPKDAVEGTKVLFTNMGDKEMRYAIPLVKILREAGIASEIYPDQVKLKKQFDYADKRGIPFLAIIGEDEITNSKISLKNLSTGEQKVIDKEDIINSFKN